MKNARRLVRPVVEKLAPINREPKMNHTEGSMKSVIATRGSRISQRDWNTAMAMAVTPTGTTSKTHQMPAKRNRPRAACPSLESAMDWPAGSTVSGKEGAKERPRKRTRPSTKGNMRRGLRQTIKGLRRCHQFGCGSAVLSHGNCRLSLEFPQNSSSTAVRPFFGSPSLGIRIPRPRL